MHIFNKIWLKSVHRSLVLTKAGFIWWKIQKNLLNIINIFLIKNIYLNIYIEIVFIPVIKGEFSA